jgi:16S rRNA (cytosine1402-N4)-methyltransferase
VAVGLDRDPGAIERAGIRFKEEIRKGRLHLFHAHFEEIVGPEEGVVWQYLNQRPRYGMFFDLGFSSDQIEDPARGLSFLREGPLDMRLSPNQGESVAEVLGKISEKELARILWEYGEERHSRRIARALVEARSGKSLPTTTTGLADLIRRAYPPMERHSRIHPATRSFQALRIHVNRELEQLQSLLKYGILNLSPGGVAAFLTFHSLEDRPVKQRFRELEKEDAWRVATKKAIEPSVEEVLANPRARSAKLRAIERQL